MPHFQSERTKMEAYLLVNDPTHLLSLLLLKYGDMNLEYYMLYANQVIYNEYSLFNLMYKEHLHNYLIEFIQRMYNYNDIKIRIPKLYDYYKNYLKFFSKPIFVNFHFNKLISDYYDSKAEIFYNNYYPRKKKEKKNNINIFDSNISFISIDNDTENDVIFNKRTKKMIDNNLDSRSCSLSFNLSTKKDLYCINNKNISSSLIKTIENFVNYQNKPKLKNTITIQKINKDNLGLKQNLKNKNIMNSPKNNNNNIYKEDKIHKVEINKIESNKNKYLIGLKNSDELKNKIDNNENKEIKRFIDKENINKNYFKVKNKSNLLFVNTKNNNEKKYLEKLKLTNYCFVNKEKIISNNKKGFYSLYNSQDEKRINKKKISKNIFCKKNISIGSSLNIFKSPKNKIQKISFYNPKANNQIIINKINSLISPINNRKRNSINDIKNQSNISVANISDLLVKPFLSISIENKTRNYNQKYKLMLKKKQNIKQSIKININTRQNKLNKFKLKNFEIKTPKGKKNRSIEIPKNVNYLSIKNSNHSLSGELNLKNTGNLQINSPINRNNKNFFIQNNFFKKLNPSSPIITKKNKIIYDNNQKIDIKNTLNNNNNNYTRQVHYKQNKYMIENLKNIKNNNLEMKGKTLFSSKSP